MNIMNTELPRNNLALAATGARLAGVGRGITTHVVCYSAPLFEPEIKYSGTYKFLQTEQTRNLHYMNE